MQALLTTLGFLAVTGVFVASHLRRTRGTAAPLAARSDACPRCGTHADAAAESCPGCGVPLRAYELVRARVMAGDHEETRDGPLHAVVRADVCVGCGTCVAACPEPGALHLVNKTAVVELDLCKGHGLCAAACPVAAIVVTSGAAVQRVEVPEVSAHFESNVPGLYVVGELGGRGLIKNAINEGRIAVEHIASALPPGAERADGHPDAFDVLIVGSGPAGMSAALEALRSNLRYAVLEQGTLFDTIARYPRRKVLFAEPVRMPLYGNLWVADASKEELIQVWRNIVERTGLDVRTGQRVQEVQRVGALFHVRTADAAYRARRVVMAVGRRGTPRRLGVPGEELDKVFYDIVEMEAFAQSRVLVVGGGDSALESALGLANQPGATVTLSHRGAEFGRAKERNRTKLAAAVEQGRVRLLLGSVPKEIRRDVVVLEHEGRVHLLPNDVVVVRIGGEAAYPLIERAGVRIVRKEIALETSARATG